MNSIRHVPIKKKFLIFAIVCLFFTFSYGYLSLEKLYQINKEADKTSQHQLKKNQQHRFGRQ